MGIFDVFSEAKESREKSRQAREYIRDAKEIVREGDDIYERAYNEVMSYAEETEYMLNQHNDYKNQLAKELDKTVSDTLMKFKSFNIDKKVISSPLGKETKGSFSMFNSNSFSFASSNFIAKLDTGSIFDIFISDCDYYEARRQYDEAKRYKERMKRERTKLRNYKDKMREIRVFIKSEKSELDSLVGKLKKMNDELKSGMSRSSFSIEEAEYLKGIHKISEYVMKLLSTEFLTDSLSINQKYKEVFSYVENINQNLPYAPSITDSNTAAVMKHIIDGTVLY